MSSDIYLGVHQFLGTSTIWIARLECSKLRNKFFLALPKAEISFLFNFQKINLYFLVCGSSFYGNRLS